MSGRPVWGTLAVGPDGEVYVSGVIGPGNGSTPLIAKSIMAQNPGLPPTFLPQVPVNMGGTAAYSVGPNPGGLLGQVWVAVNQQPGPRRGHVYMLCSLNPPGADPLDVMFVRSTDGGLTWSAPVRER
ncbi:MAG: exo-alpha-sialidase [Phycisphaerales bacterium]|nr:exo-alpha-sialidase [Phycisphaerales bacterium]